MIQCPPGPTATMRAVAAIVHHLLRGGHHSNSAAVRGGFGGRLGLGAPR